MRRPLKISPEQFFFLMHQLNERSTLYKHTRGLHNLTLATQNEIILFRADIGRHNAVDMINGEFFLRDIALEDRTILITGSITSEVLLKTVKMGYLEISLLTTL
jgi:FdhD protein